MTDVLYANITKLKPEILRYPGGTVTHSWDWRRGVIEKRPSKKAHPISEIRKLVDTTGAGFVFVLDIANKSLADQIEMLTAIEKLGVEIRYIELGNELYSQEANYRKVFPTGADYAKRVNTWVPELRKKFPKAKIGALLSGRKVKPSNTRIYNWNRQVVDGTIGSVDAYTYHIYIGETTTFAKEKAEFIEVTEKAKTQDKDLWITEYGNKQDKSKPSYYRELSALADFVESFPNVTIALNHQIVWGTKAKLTEDGKSFVEEGKLFLRRASH
jgi:alpha-L-arabinofuranosidase